MRRLLALLICFLLVQTQTYGLSGGPNYGGSPQALVGTYGGVMLPEDVDVVGTDPLLIDVRKNAIALFTFGLPSNGLGTGEFVLFAEGLVSFLGDISVFGDPGDMRIYGILDTTLGITTSVSSSGNSTGGTFTGHAAGKMEAKAEGGSNPSAGYITRINGDAFVTIDEGVDAVSGEIILVQKLDFKVVGLRQSTAEPATSAGATGGSGA